MQDILDDFVVYRARYDHLHHLRLNLTKCAFGVTSDALLGHIASREGIAVDPGKINAIITTSTLRMPKH